MPAVTRKGDSCSGHGCWPPRPSVEGADFFTVNGQSVHCQGHAWGPHTCPSIPETHSSILGKGAAFFTVNGLPIGRVGDPVACGSKVAQGADFFTVTEK